MTDLTQPRNNRGIDITEASLLATQGLTKIYGRSVENLITQRSLSGCHCSYTICMENQPDQKVHRRFISDVQLQEFLLHSDYAGGNNEDLLKAYILGV